MDKHNRKSDEDIEVKCAMCNVIPDSHGMTVEVEDYIMHFCGEECFAYWREKYQKQNGKKNDK